MAHVPKTKGVNPMVARFRQRTKPSHTRIIHCHRMDETPAGWACHSKIMMPGQNYVRHITEWFPPDIWEHLEHGYHNPRKRTLKKMAAAKAAEQTPEPVPVRQKIESPKNPPPPITFDEDDTEEIPVQNVVPIQTAPKKYSDKEEVPGEYNPRAHPEKVMGAEEDLIVFDDLVGQNFIAQQRRNKLMQLRARQKVTGSPAAPIVSGFEPG